MKEMRENDSLTLWGSFYAAKKYLKEIHGSLRFGWDFDLDVDLGLDLDLYLDLDLDLKDIVPIDKS